MRLTCRRTFARAAVRFCCGMLLTAVFQTTLFAQAPVASASPGIEADVRVGFGGQLKVGCWTPVSVGFKSPLGDAATVVVITADYENNLLETPLARVSPTRAAGMIEVGRIDGALEIIVREGGEQRPLARLPLTGSDQNKAYRRSTEFWGVLGSTARFAEAAEERTAAIRKVQGHTVPEAAVTIPLDWNQLPDRVEAWDALDVIVVGGAAYNLSEENSAKLRRWTERGGRLLLLFGTGVPDYLKSPLAKWSPIQVREQVNVASLESLNVRVGQSAALRVGRRSVAAAKIAGPPEGTLPGPAVLSKPYGFGFVTGFAFDFEQPPLSTWENQTGLLRQLMTPATTVVPRATGESDLSSIGVTDLASQLMSGLDRFEQVQRPSFRGVMLWTILWMLVLLPIDYLVVHKLLKRPHLTWLTLPVLIAIATFAASRSATAANTAPLTLNQIDLLDYTPQNSTARTRSWMTFYSDESARYDVAAMSAFQGPAQLTWNAKPEEGLRGLYRQGGINFGSPTYRTNAEHTTLQGLPVRQWSSFSIAAEWTGENLSGPPLVDATLAEIDAGRLTGGLKHHLPQPLKEWIVVYKNFVYYPFRKRGDLSEMEWLPGAEWRPDIEGQATLVRGFLTGRREMQVPGSGKDAKLDQIASEVEPYETTAFDPPRLIRMLSFHEAAGGSNYTGLSNFPLAKLDLSRALDTTTYKGIDSAYLIGRMETPVINYQIQGEAAKPASSWTFVRAALPVKMP